MAKKKRTTKKSASGASKRRTTDKTRKSQPIKKKSSKRPEPQKQGSVDKQAQRASSPQRAMLETAQPQQKLFDWQCDNVANDCVKAVTQSNRPYSRSDSLQQYGVNSAEECRAVVDLITGDPGIGVRRYGFKVDDTSKLSGLASGWTMGQLANTIQDSAVPEAPTNLPDSEFVHELK